MDENEGWKQVGIFIQRLSCAGLMGYNSLPYVVMFIYDATPGEDELNVCACDTLVLL